jgi:MoxR-like ATPase
VSASKIKADQYFDEASSLLSTAKAEIEKIIIGQSAVVENTLATLACGGHVLLIGVPGLAKTLLVDTTAHVMGLESARVQCTPDLMPPIFSARNSRTKMLKASARSVL